MFHLVADVLLRESQLYMQSCRALFGKLKRALGPNVDSSMTSSFNALSALACSVPLISSDAAAEFGDDAVQSDAKELESGLRSYLRQSLMQGGECNIEVSAGAGGEDSADWANMLLNMYVKFATRELGSGVHFHPPPSPPQLRLSRKVALKGVAFARVASTSLMRARSGCCEERRESTGSCGYLPSMTR